MTFDIQFLQAFHAICETGSFRKAAEKMHVTQPAISYQIQKLEDQLRVALFERLGRRIVLTAAGNRLNGFCSRFFAELENLSEELGDNLPARTAPLRIASVSGFGRFILFPILSSKRFAHLRLELTYSTAAEVFESIERGDCDFGAVYLTKVSNYLKFVPVYREELVMISPKDFPLTKESIGTIDSYATLPFITYEESDYVFGKWFDAFFGAQPTATHSVSHFEELEEVIDMVRLGRGLSLVPLDSAAAVIRNKRIRVLRPKGKHCWNQLFLVLRAGTFVREEVHQIIELLQKKGRTSGSRRRS
jgi:DNA-binding transcriptional LysR family regulator